MDFSTLNSSVLPLIQSSPVPIALVSLAVSLVGTLVAVLAVSANRKAYQRYKKLLAGPTGKNLDQVLLTQAAALEAAATRIQALEDRCRAQEDAAVGHVQHVGIVRFNAFHEVGSDLSFAVALLDGKLNGVVISSLYGRDDSRIYAKPLTQGGSSYALTPEERQAIYLALGRSESSPNRQNG
ncbi:MAG: DUF4446 family protein [Firmicutes bacterium]|nr:DUF4446 family protein [Bacillota bacterium]